MVKIEYWNSYDIMDVYYAGSYRNRFWLDVVIKKPQYIITREAIENGLNETVNQFMKY